MESGRKEIQGSNEANHNKEACFIQYFDAETPFARSLFVGKTDSIAVDSASYASKETLEAISYSSHRSPLHCCLLSENNCVGLLYA